MSTEYDEVADAAAEEITIEAPVETPEPTPDVEAATPEVEASKEEDKGPEPQVNLGALHQARAKEREATAEVQTLRDNYARLEERTNRLLAAQQAPPEPEPTVEDDPIAVLEAVRAQQVQDNQNRDQQAQQQQQQYQQQQQFQALTNRVREGEATFAAENPDYEAAANHAWQSKQAQLATQGYGPAEIQSMITQEAYTMAQRSIEVGMNPAQAVYDLAKQMGYQPTSDTIANVEAGQKAATSLDGGGKALSNVTAADLGAMSDEDFEKNFEKVYGAS